MDPACLILPMEQWLTSIADTDSLVAWSRTQRWQQSDFRFDVSQLLQRLKNLPHKRWALCFDNSYHFAVAMLATLYSGKIPVLPGHQRQSLLEEQLSEFDALLTDCSLSLPCPTLLLPITFSDENSFTENDSLIPLPEFPATGSVVLFTSGSTGKPQKITKTITSLQTESRWLAQRWGLSLRKGRLAATVSSQHMYGLTFRFMLPLSLRVPFFAENLEVHEQLVAMAQQFPLTVISSPAFLQRLDPHLEKVKCQQVFSAGGPLSVETAAHVQQLFGVCPVDIYGTSETGILASRQQRLSETPWTLFDGVELLFENNSPTRAVSELIPQPEGIPLSDNLRIADNNRQFHLLGRQDRIVKIAEQRLSLDEIEQRLCQLPTVAKACVLQIEKKDRSYVAAVIVLSATGAELLGKESQVALTQGLRQSLRGWLAPVAIPRFWRVIQFIPMNLQGKIIYSELRELFL